MKTVNATSLIYVYPSGIWALTYLNLIIPFSLKSWISLWAIRNRSISWAFKSTRSIGFQETGSRPASIQSLMVTIDLCFKKLLGPRRGRLFIILEIEYWALF